MTATVNRILPIFRPSTGTWWIRKQQHIRIFRQFSSVLRTDIPVAADYDADGKTDIAVFRPSTGVWYILQSTLGLILFNGDRTAINRLPAILKATAKPIWLFTDRIRVSGIF